MSIVKGDIICHPPDIFNHGAKAGVKENLLRMLLLPFSYKLRNQLQPPVNNAPVT